MANILKFFDERHTYELNGELVPSVSELSRFASREVYGDISQYTLDNAADRGSKVHKACENLDRYGDCEVDDGIAPYIKAYLAFHEEHQPEWVAIEKPLASEAMKFAGTLDRVGKIKGVDGLVIVDLKSSSVVQKVLALIQLNGYKKLYEENFGEEIKKLYILHLQKDERYKLIEFPMDDTLFMACWHLHQAFKKKPRKKKGEPENV